MRCCSGYAGKGGVRCCSGCNNMNSCSECGIVRCALDRVLLVVALDVVV